MEYVIFDLEWDSVYFPPEKRFINQILQIGAVKLDGEFKVTDRLSVTVCSAISRRVTSRFAKLTGISSEIMRSGLPLEEAVMRYNSFAQNADVTMTWSNSDLYTILENEELLLKNKLKFKINSYLDLQKLVQHRLQKNGYESKNQISLESAAHMLNVDTIGFEFHTALDDCLVCAELFKLCYDSARFNELLTDASSEDFYKRLRFKSYALSDINDKLIKKSELKFLCPKCGYKAHRLSNWKYRNRWFTSNFKCDKCDYKFNGRVTFIKTYDDLKVKHKICEYKPKKRNTNDMQSLSETVQSTENRS